MRPSVFSPLPGTATRSRQLHFTRRLPCCRHCDSVEPEHRYVRCALASRLLFPMSPRSYKPLTSFGFRFSFPFNRFNPFNLFNLFNASSLSAVFLLGALTPVHADNKLSGTIIGTAGSWNNGGNTKEKAMDGNLSTFFDGPDPGTGE